MDHWNYMQHIQNQENGGPNYRKNMLYLALACFAAGAVVTWLIMRDTDENMISSQPMADDNESKAIKHNDYQSTAHLGLSIFSGN